MTAEMNTEMTTEMTTETIIDENRIIEKTFRDGKYYRVFRDFYSFHQQLHLEITYIGKKKHGYLKKWYPHGVLKKHIEYTDGKMNGVFQRWHENRQLHMYGICSKGKRIGTWVYYNKDGSIQNKRTWAYTNGKRSSTLV